MLKSRKYSALMIKTLNRQLVGSSSETQRTYYHGKVFVLLYR